MREGGNVPRALAGGMNERQTIPMIAGDRPTSCSRALQAGMQLADRPGVASMGTPAFVELESYWVGAIGLERD